MVDKAALIGISELARLIRTQLVRKNAIEVFPSLLYAGDGHPLIPALHTTALGKKCALSQDARMALIQALERVPATYAITSSFRDYKEAQPNRLLEFHYVQFAFQENVDELLRFSTRLFKQIVRKTSEAEWLPLKRRMALKDAYFRLPIFDYAELCEAAGISTGKLTFEEEISAIRRMGNEPIVVRNYTPTVKPNVPDMRLVEVSDETRLANFSILVPGLGSLLDGGELESNPARLRVQMRNSDFYAALKSKSPAREEGVDNYIAIHKGLGRKKVSIGGLGLERTLQFLIGAKAISAVTNFPVNVKQQVISPIA